MPTYRIQHCFQGRDGTSKDMYCNQFFLFHQTASMDDLAPNNQPWGSVISAQVGGFYDDDHGTATAISAYLSKRVEGLGRTVKIYDTANPAESPPVHVETFSQAVNGTVDLDPLPEEVAVCLSYRAVTTGSNAPRRRGRIYIGPLNQAAIDVAAENYAPVHVNPDFMTTLIENAAAFNASLLGAGWHWRVFSKMDGFGFDIIEFSVDDAFDTVRGRGTAPTGRLTGVAV